MNVGYLKSGHNINIVPDAAEAHISFMVPYGFDYRKILHLVNKIVKRYTKSGNGSIKITYYDGTDPALTDPDAGIVSSVARAYTSVKKKKPRLVFDTGVSDAVFYRKAGVDTASYGPGAFSQAHQYNERVSIKEIRIAKRIYKQAAIDFLGVE
jgi:acetylornithine deacetylase/succinyl-diaminopimelate desuccinylase-like protein